MAKDELYGVKDLYQGAILADTPVTINGIRYEENDILLFFDSIQEITFSENKEEANAKGGFDNRDLVNWTTTKSISCALYNGRISKAGYGIINKTLLNKVSNIKSIRQFDKTYSDNHGKVELKHIPNTSKPIKVFAFQNGMIDSEILDYQISQNTLIVKEKDIDILVDYWFDYSTEANSISIGDKSLSGYLKFVGKFYYTDEQGSSRKTAIIEIPKIKIESNFSISFGRNTSPIVSILQFNGIPKGDREKSQTMKITYLEDDIDGDI